MKRETGTVYDPPVSFERMRELVKALDADAELSKIERGEIAVVLSDIDLTFNAYRRRRGAPISRTRSYANLAVQVAKRFDVKDAAAVSAAAPEATARQQAAIERTMRKIRSGEVKSAVAFLDEAIDRAGARLKKRKTGNK